MTELIHMRAVRIPTRGDTMNENHAMKLSESLQGLGHPVAYYPILGKVFGMQESIFLAQFVYWTGKGDDPDGWIYKSAEEIQQETGLTYEQQQRVRKVLGSHERYGVRGSRIRRVHFEQIIEEKYDRTKHRMYYRVNLPALDRAFSENLFSGLNSGAVGYYPSTHLGKARQGTWVKPSSSIQRLLPETTIKEVVRKKAHTSFVSFFDEMSKKTRGVKPSYDKAGFKNLRVALKTVHESSLERLALYFLADSKFRGYKVDLKVFLSGGVMKALADQERKDGFVKRLDGYIDQYLSSLFTPGPRTYPLKDMRSSIEELRQKFTV